MFRDCFTRRSEYFFVLFRNRTVATNPQKSEEPRAAIPHAEMAPSYELRFRQHTDAPSEFRELYKKVYDDLMAKDGYRFDAYLHMWIDKLKNDNVGTAVDRQYLNRAEGGIGGNDNDKHRQIRLPAHGEPFWGKFAEISLLAIPSNDEECKWDLEELVEFGEKFKEVLQSSVLSTSIDFYIAVHCM